MKDRTVVARFGILLGASRVGRRVRMDSLHRLTTIIDSAFQIIRAPITARTKTVHGDQSPDPV